MKNLLTETEIAITKSGHTALDIKYIGSRDGYSCDWSRFEVLANVEYCESFGSQNVATDLVVVFNDGEFLRRAEYDGSEWWEHIKPFVIPEERFKIKELIDDSYQGYSTLKEINL